MMNALLKSVAALAALSMLAGCMAAPAKREVSNGLDPRRACIAQCNRDNNVCMDQQSTQSRNTDFGMGATCSAELQGCLARC